MSRMNQLFLDFSGSQIQDAAMPACCAISWDNLSLINLQNVLKIFAFNKWIKTGLTTNDDIYPFLCEILSWRKRGI